MLLLVQMYILKIHTPFGHCNYSDRRRGYLWGVKYHAWNSKGRRGRFSPILLSGTVFRTDGYSAEYGQALSSALI